MKLKTTYLIIFSMILLMICLMLISSFSNITAHTSKELSFAAPTVIIDAGHGGEDGGAEVDGILEKDVNLAIANQLADMLRISGFRVIETRDTDTAIYSKDAQTLREKKVSDLKNRVSLFNKSDDRIVVSIHQNKFEQAKYHGTQIFYSVNHEKSVQLARGIQTSVVMLLQSDNTRELKPAGSDIYILDKTTVPAVIVECGFLSNDEEREKLTTPKYQQQMSYAIAMGIIDYYNSNKEG